MVSAEIRKSKSVEWYSRFGTPAKMGLYFNALEDPNAVLDYRATHPARPEFHQDVDRSLFPDPGHSIYEFTGLPRLKLLFENANQVKTADDGSIKSGIGNYVMWLRLIDPETWKGEPFWDGDCVAAGTPTGRTRMATLLKNGFDYLKELEYRKATYKMDKYLAAIRTKPFVLLAGISGTGKSRMVRQLARGCCPAEGPLARDSKPGNFEMIQVRPNWHDSTELMGYVTRITSNQKPKYVMTPFVRFLVKAWLNPEIPFFLCLDEMNLAPVEQYFAEYLSVIETRRRAIEKDVVPGCIKTGDVMTDVLVSLNPEVVEGVISELSEAFSLDRGSCVLTETPPAEEKKRDKDSLYKQWDEFLVAWPISRLRTITLDEYTKAGSPDTFTYALEAKLSRLGSIWGGSAFKFGIYSRDPNGKMTTYAPNSNQMGNAEYAWYRKFGSTQEAAWSSVKERVVSIAEAASKGDFSAVDKIDLPHVVKWKIAFLYQDRKDIKIVDVFKREWIYLLTANMPPKTSFADRYLKLNEERNGMDVFEWDDTVLTRRKNELLSADGSSDADDDDEGDEDVKGVTSPNSPLIDMIRKDGGIRIPPNLVVMGTVNMDETTCSFSRKVLDRAMTFELNKVNMDEGLASDNSIPYGSIPADQAFATDVEGCDFYPANKDLCDKVKTYLLSVNAVLEDTPFKFAYRSRNEIMLYCIERTKGGVVSLARALDEATSMKILSRIEGDDQKLLYVGNEPAYKDKSILDALKGEIAAALRVANGEADPADCTVCAKKLDFMARRLDGGFTNFFV